MSRRRLRPDELELWQKVAKTTDRMHSEQALPKAPAPAPGPELRNSAPEPDPAPITRFELGQKSNGQRPAHDVLPGLPEQLAAAPVRMDKKTHTRLKRGKLMPEGRIDLHGMTLQQAQPALTSFIMSSFARDRRLVLVITGKGKRADDDGPIPVRPGILRHNVPHWLQTPPLAQMILQVTEANGRHGGGGAYYVYLRRRR